MISLDGFRALRPVFWACFVLFQLFVWLLGSYFEGQYFGGNVKTTGGLIVMAAGCFVSAIIMFAIIGSSTVRKWATNSEKYYYYEPICFGFAGIIFVFIGVGALLSIGWYSTTSP